MGVTVSLSGALPKSYGRPSGVDPPDTTVFADRDGDGIIDHGGNAYVTRAPRPKVVDPNNPSAFQAARQVIEVFHTYNQYGQPIFTINPDQSWLLDPSRQYPVTIDPSTSVIQKQSTQDGGSVHDCHITSGTQYGDLN